MNARIPAILCLLFGITNAIGYECGASIEASDEGQLTSPDFPSNYAHNMSCESIIDSSSRDSITILFTHMAIDCSDKLQIWDGESNLMLKEVCGFDLMYLETETFKIKIYFEANENRSSMGWRMVWNTVVRGPNVHLSSPSDNSKLTLGVPDQSEILRIIVTVEGGVADLNVNVIDLGSNHDEVIFFEEPSGKEIGSYGRNYVNYVTSETDSLSMWITFDYDGDDGIEIQLSVPGDECLTNSHNSSTGVITSHGYPDIYYGRRDYRWCINSPTGKGINIHITDMNLQNPDCTDEYVEVIDREGNTTLLQHCENKPIYLRTNSISVVVIFHSSYFDGVGGWRLEWDDDETTTTSTTMSTTSTTTSTTTITTTTPTTTTTTPTTTTTTTVPATTTTTTVPTSTSSTTTGFSPRPPSKYNDTPCETSARFYGVCQYNNIECVNGTYTDRLCRRPMNQGQITSNVGEVYRSCCITGSTAGYSAKQIV